MAGDLPEDPPGWSISRNGSWWKPRPLADHLPDVPAQRTKQAAVEAIREVDPGAFDPTEVNRG